MKYTKRVPSMMKTIAMLVAIGTLLVMGCSPKATVKTSDQDISDTPVKKMITGIMAEDHMDSVVVLVQGNQALTFTSVKQPFPPGVILYFPETNLDQAAGLIEPEIEMVQAIKASELVADGKTTRIEITLEDDLPYDVVKEDSNLKITFKKPAPDDIAQSNPAAESESAVETTETAPAAAAPEVQNHLQSVYANKSENAVEIIIRADSAIEDYKTFTIENPARIVFDLFNIKSSYEREHLVSVNSEWVKSVRHFGYPDRVRLVIDTKPEYLTEYTAQALEDGFVILVGSEAPSLQATKAEKSNTAESTGKPAWINRIDFSSREAGQSSIIIGTTQPVQYELKKAGEKRLQLSLFDTRLPAYRQRPLITTRFQSAVDRIIPLQTEAMKNRTEISIELREQVPYRVEQVEDLLLVHFEASTVAPKPLDESELPEWKKVASETVKLTAEEAAALETEVMALKTPEAAALTEEPVEEGRPTGPEKKYTGEKIALDFFETDIKNVFRILREISGENFAIDKDVKGSVNLTFEKPVPWDQVLDLVLKMNQLGKVYEGNIIRIATLKTLKTEKDARRKAVEAEQKSKEQIKALEPLVTEYIAVSYSNASSEVKPHLEKILTKERGSISVDSRTNQIIVTDTADVIAQAREIVKKIDKVTPQVIIEARIVEATSSFSREIGVVWGAGYGEQSSDLLDVDGLTSDVTSALDDTVGDGDGTYGTNMAVNLPTASVATLGFNFIKLDGTPLLLNAQLMAMESQGKLEIVSAPKIVTLDNKTATIKQGVQYPYNKLDADGNTTTEFIDIVLELNATPHVTPDNRISMKVTIKKSDLGSVINSQQSFTTKEAETELLVDDGDTVVIGGIIKSTVSESESGIPFLSDIPILGWAFKSKAKSDDKEELLIFITPRIVQLQQRST